jgi:hypothetical protein
MKKTLKSKILFALAGFIMAFSTVPSAFAVERQQIREELKENRQEFVQEQKDTRTQLQGLNKENIASRVGAVKNFFNTRATLNNAKITGKGTGSLTVEKDSVFYTILIDEKTRLRRRFFGEAKIDEIAVGNTVNIFGKWTDETHKTIQAALIRDMSIQKRFGAFVGDVTAVNGNDITIATVHRGTQKATVSDLTKIVDRKEVALTLADIKVGHRLRVKGMWDKSNNTITEVTQVKDYTLPVKPTPKPKVTVTPTATPTPTPTVAVTPTP